MNSGRIQPVYTPYQDGVRNMLVVQQHLGWERELFTCGTSHLVLLYTAKDAQRTRLLNTELALDDKAEPVFKELGRCPQLAIMKVLCYTGEDIEDEPHGQTAFMSKHKKRQHAVFLSSYILAACCWMDVLQDKNSFAR